MKRSLFLAFISLFFLVACTGFDTDKVSGQLKSRDGRFTINTSNGLIDIDEGLVDFRFNTGLIGIYDPSISIVQNGVEVGELKIPRNGFQNNSVKISASELKQDFGLEATLSDSEIEKWTHREESVSCDYYGYCYGCKLITNSDGELVNDCGYDNRYDCDGTRWEIRENRRYAQQLLIKFLKSGSNEEIASFKGKASNIRQETKVLEHGTCL